MIDQLGDQLVFKVQPITAISHSDIRVLHRNILFSIKTSEKSSLKEPENQSPQSIALMMANMQMDIYFNV